MSVLVSKRIRSRTRCKKMEEDAPKQQNNGYDNISLGSILCRFLYRVPAAIVLLFLVYLWSSSTTVISGNIVHICVSSRKLNNLYCLSAGSHPSFNVPVAFSTSNNSNVTDAAVGDSNIAIKEETNVVLDQDSIGPVKNSSDEIGDAKDRVPPAPRISNGSVYVQDENAKEKKPSFLATEETSSGSTVREPETGVTSRTSVDEDAAKIVLDQDDLETGEKYNYITFKDGKEEKAVKAVEDLLQVHRSWRASQYSKNGNKVGGCDGKGIYVYDLPSKFNADLIGQCDDMVPWANFCNFFKNNALGEPIEKLGKGWYHTHQYSLEPIFHSRVLKHPCRVYDESQAKLFYVPFYGGLDILRWHFKNVSDDVKDSLGKEMIKWLDSKKSWKRNSGKDHVFVLGKISWDFRRNGSKNWGSKLLELQEMQDPVKLLIERHPWHVNDVGIPHPTYFHPHSDEDIISWQLKIIGMKRNNLVSFAGAARPGQPGTIRSILIEQCKNSNDTCRFLDCKQGGCDRPESVIDLFTDSEFCLQPGGDSPTRKSVFDSLVSGCIPVLFDPYSAYYQYAWHLPDDHNRYSVYIEQEDVRGKKVNVVERLMGVSLREREDMRSYIVHELLPGLLYGDPDSKLERFQDAFAITINNLFERIDKLG